MKFRDQSDDYHQLNAGAHRRRATNVTTPTLAWYRAFWLSPRYSPDRIFTDDEISAERLMVKDKIDFMIQSLLSAIHQEIFSEANQSNINKTDVGETKAPEFSVPTVSPVLDGTYCLFGRMVKLTTLDGLKFSKVKPRSRRALDVFSSDNRVVSIKYTWLGVGITVRIELHTEYFSIAVFAELPDDLTSVTNVQLLKHYEDLLLHFKQASRASGEELNKYFLHEFWERFLERIFKNSEFKQNVRESTLFREIFADFRGMILGKNFGDIEDPDFGESENLNWGHKIEDQCRYLCKFNDKYECAANYMLDGRAAYFSSLGAQSPLVSDDELIPLEYIVYAHEAKEEGENGINRWQLGRLVDRIHLLGTARLASMKYLPSLRNAGRQLAQLDAYVKRAREAIVPEKEDRQKGLRVESAKDLKEAHRIFGSITTNFNESTKTNTGVLYRVERSRYYSRQFRIGLGGLRIRRLEGFSRYDQFVERRLGPAFDFINRLGTRYERAVSTLSLLDQFYISMRTNEIDNDVRVIQLIGETALWGALVPYYVASLLSHVVEHDALKSMTIIVWVFFFGIAGIRVVDLALDKLAPEKQLRMPSWLTTVLSGLLGAITLLLLLGLLYATGVVKFLHDSHALPANNATNSNE